MKPAYPIETERLVLRPFVADDIEALYGIFSRAEVARYLYWEPKTREEVREALELRFTRTTIEKEGDALSLGVERRDSGEVIGDVVLIWVSEQHRQGELGYIFHPDHSGQGFATEASREMLRLSFDELRWHRIIGRLDGRNTASARVLERLGMRREAHLVENEFVKGEWTDEVIYAMLESEWAAQSKR